MDDLVGLGWWGSCRGSSSTVPGASGRIEAAGADLSLGLVGIVRPGLTWLGAQRPFRLGVLRRGRYGGTNEARRRSPARPKPASASSTGPAWTALYSCGGASGFESSAMKITKEVVRQFEDDQKKHGTGVAIHNLLWQVAAALMKDLGVKRVRTSGVK